MKRFKTVFLLEYPTVSGGEQSLFELLRGMDRERFTAACIVPEEGRLSQRLSELDVPFAFFPLGRGKAKRQPEEVGKELAAALRQMDASLVHANSLSMALYSGLAGELAQIPSVAHLRDIVKLSGARMAALQKNDVLIAVSRAVRDWYVEQGCAPEKIRVVYNGVECGRFYELGSAEAAIRGKVFRNAAGIDSDVKLVGAAGQICLRKAPEVFLKAAKRVREAGKIAFFCFAGERFSEKEESVELEKELHRYVTGERLADYVRFLGYLPDMRPFYAGIDILVNTSMQEPLGRVILEGMANGLPAVATDVGGTGEMIREGKEGILVPPGDADAVAEAVIRLMEDSELRARLGAAARKRVKERFSTKGMVEGIEAVYKDLGTGY